MKEACENRILVTRGSSFMGTNLADALIGTEASVVNVGIKAPRSPDHRSTWRRLDSTLHSNQQRSARKWCAS